MANEKVDVAIIGAGMAGAIFAAVLTKAGKKVVLLEHGPGWKQGDFISSEIWGRRLKGGAPVVLEGRNRVGYGFNGGWGTGGSAIHYYANFPRLMPNDFTSKSEHGRGLDWPINYDDLAPYYDRAARDLGVSGDAEAEKKWLPQGTPYPMPPLKTFRHGEIWKKGFEANGITLAPMPTAINSVDDEGRPACIYDGWCHIGCPIGALASPIVTYLDQAKGAEVRNLSYVTRVLTHAQGTKVTGVEYYDAKKERQVQEANVVVVAAFSGQTPRILLNSTTDKHPKGLANANGLVGKYIMCHTGATTWAIFEENVENHMGTSAAQFVSYDHYSKTHAKDAFGSSLWLVSPALKPNDLGGFANSRADLFGAELEAYMQRAARGLTRIQCFGEELPNVENRVERASEKDEFGLPLARIIHSFDRDALALWQQSLEEGTKIAKAAGPQEFWGARAGPPSIHMIGGTIMGTDASNSVTNSYGQTHEVTNLYLAGAGLFPTEGAVNPTFALSAVTLRGAEHLAKHWSSIAG